MVARKIYPIVQPVNCLYCGKFFFRILNFSWQARIIPWCCIKHRKLHTKEVKEGRRRNSRHYIQSITIKRPRNWGWIE